MKKQTFACLLAGSILAAVNLTAVAAGDAERGKLTAYTCSGCHGIPGYNNVYPTYKVPKVGGQNYAYLVSALKAYRDGDRQHRTMVAQAGSLSDQDIEDVAAYFSSLGQAESAGSDE